MQFCFGPWSSPKTEYHHSSNSYSLISWSDQACIFTWTSHLKCWESTTLLGWLTWPMNADAERRLSIALKDSDKFSWSPCFCPIKTFDTPRYQVYSSWVAVGT